MMQVAEWEILAQRYPCVELKDAKGELTSTWLTCPARLAFDKITTPEDGKYSCALIFPPNADLAVLFDAAKRTAGGKWGDKAASMGLRSPFKSQAEVAGKYDGFADTGFFINVASKFAPEFLALDGRSNLTLSTDILWAGCYVRACVTAYTYDKDGQGKPVKPGVSFGLKWLQFTSAGDPFSGGLNPADHLQPITGVPAYVPSKAITPPAMNGVTPAAAPAAKPAGSLF